MQILKRIFDRLARPSRQACKRYEAWHRGIAVVPPNYVYRPLAGPHCIVVDVGCADDADFSQHLIARFGVTAFAVDPTRKHEPALRALEKRLRPKLIHLPLALANRAGRVPFNESVENVSGSLLAGHVNVRRDHVKSYEVEAVTLADLTLRIGYARIDLLKLDIEGAEFDLLREVAPEHLRPFAQIFVEFHHQTVAGYEFEHTLALVQRIERFGFSAFTLDDRNWLFWQP